MVSVSPIHVAFPSLNIAILCRSISFHKRRTLLSYCIQSKPVEFATIGELRLRSRAKYRKRHTRRRNVHTFPLSRRQMLQHMGTGLGAIGLAGIFADARLL